MCCVQHRRPRAICVLCTASASDYFLPSLLRVQRRVGTFFVWASTPCPSKNTSNVGVRQPDIQQAAATNHPSYLCTSAITIVFVPTNLSLLPSCRQSLHSSIPGLPSAASFFFSNISSNRDVEERKCQVGAGCSVQHPNVH